MLDSNDERYEQKLVKRRQETEEKLREEEEQQQAEQRARKEARAAEKRRQEEKLRKRVEEEKMWRKAEEKETWRREKEHQRDLAHCIEVDHITAIEQQCCKNWSKTFLPSSPLSDEDMNLIDLPLLTKRQRIQYLPQETLEAHQWHEELAKEMEVSAVGGGSLCERCADFGILCIPQNLL